jgi:hypothetical protein
MSYMLPHLDSGYAVDQAILSEEDRVVIIRFGHDWDPVRNRRPRAGRDNNVLGCGRMLLCPALAGATPGPASPARAGACGAARSTCSAVQGRCSPRRASQRSTTATDQSLMAR